MPHIFEHRAGFVINPLVPSILLNAVSCSTTNSEAAKNTSNHLTHCKNALQSFPPTMKLLHLLTALLTVLALSPPTIQSPPPNTDPTTRTCYASARRWPARATSQPRMQSSTTMTGSKASACHVPVRLWSTRVMIQPRKYRARPDEVSLSPPALANSPASTPNDTSKHHNSTSPLSHILPQPPTWVLTLEDLVTAIFRIVSIVLALFNINITWRFHGKCHEIVGRTSTKLTCSLANQGHRPREVRYAWAGVRFV